MQEPIPRVIENLETRPPFWYHPPNPVNAKQVRSARRPPEYHTKTTCLMAVQCIA